jgi:hypothetical protein
MQVILGGYRSFAISVYKNASESMKPGASYVVYAVRCNLSGNVLEFAASGSWDEYTPKSLEVIRKQIGSDTSPAHHSTAPAVKRSNCSVS